MLGKVPLPPSSVLPKSSLQDYFIDLWDLSLQRIASCSFDLSYHQETDLRVLGVCVLGGGSCVSSAWGGAMWRHPFIEWVIPCALRIYQAPCGFHGTNSSQGAFLLLVTTESLVAFLK